MIEIKKGGKYYLHGAYPAEEVIVIQAPDAPGADVLVKHPTGPTYQSPARMHLTRRQADEATLSEKMTQLANFRAKVTELGLEVESIEVRMKEDQT